MTSGTLLTLFLCFFIIEFIVHWVLDLLNAKYVRLIKNIPEFFKHDISEDAFQKSRRYTQTKLHFNKFQLLFSTTTTIFILFSGVLPRLHHFLAQSITSTIFQGVCFFFILFTSLGILRFPLGLYETFQIEAKFGFNKTTLKLYLIDMIKTIFLTSLLGIPFLIAIFWFMNCSGQYWWVWVFLFLTCFQMILLIIYPVLLAPLFNKFTPLEEGILKDTLLKLTRKNNFPSRGIFVMDGSKRSSHSNAYFTGFGKLRRIVLFDTLISQMSVDEMKNILCHEIGHYKMGHIYKSLIFNFIITGIGLYILSLLIDWPPLFQAFGFEARPSELKHVGLFLFSFMASTFTFLLAPLLNYRSRQHEFQADRYAVKHAEKPTAMASALMKLAEKNLSNLTPHPWYSAFHYSHPSLHERIQAIYKQFNK
ncbi:MAG: M48 family metallopeptidase [Fibrobacteria bacterium]|nr:M48 family metallopeptidase [Fibrobacteria bacterium]